MVVLYHTLSSRPLVAVLYHILVSSGPLMAVPYHIVSSRPLMAVLYHIRIL